MNLYQIKDITEFLRRSQEKARDFSRGMSLSITPYYYFILSPPLSLYSIGGVYRV